MQITVQIKELIQNVTSTDVHCIKRHSRCFAYGVGVVGGVTNYALLISKCSRSPPESSGAEVGRERGNPTEIAFCYACSIYPSRNRARVSLRIHGTRDTFHGVGHPRQRARQGVSPRRAADVITFAQASQLGHRAQKPFEHMALCHPVNLRFTHATDGRRTKVITATRAADMREEGAQRRDARRVSHFFLVGGHPGGSPAKVRIASCTP